MTIDGGNGEFHAGPENAMILVYPNDMMDGFFVDLEDNYCFISAMSEGFAHLKEVAIAEGIPIGHVGEDADLDEYPHQYVINSLGHFVVQAAEEILRGNNL